MAQADSLGLRRELRGAEYVVLRQQLIAGRIAAGLTQSVLAERLGRPQSFVAKIEGGDRSVDVVEFLAITSILKLDPLYVLAAMRGAAD